MYICTVFVTPVYRAVNILFHVETNIWILQIIPQKLLIGNPGKALLYIFVWETISLYSHRRELLTSSYTLFLVYLVKVPSSQRDMEIFLKRRVQ